MSHRHASRSNQIAQHIPGPDGRQLVGISYKYNPRAGLKGLQKMVEKHLLHHRAFINYKHIGIYLLVAVSLSLPITQQAVYSGGVGAG